jgi:hypothetical protein
MRRRWALATMAAMMLGACGGPQASDPAMLSVDYAGFRLRVPDGWSAEATNNSEGQLQTVAFISNLPLDLRCRGQAAKRSCSRPTSLEEGSLLITWLAGFCPACSPPPGEPIVVGGREASLVDGSTICEPLEPTDDETYFVVVTPQRLDAIVVCKRDAPAEADATLRDMLEHVEWRTP